MAAKSQKPKQAPSKHLLARPLDSLFFLLPLILFYEAIFFLMAPAGIAAASDRVIAFQFLQVFFDLFGLSAILMPGLAVIAILLATHLVSRQPWRFNGRTVVSMYVESLLWAVPLLAVNRFTNITATFASPPTWIADWALCVGAGIYEELVFRLCLISLIVMIGADLLRFNNSSTLVAAVMIAAGFFALHHHPPFGGEPFDAFRFTFRTLAGLYLGTIFVFRGYGPAAGAHIAYNLIVTASIF